MCIISINILFLVPGSQWEKIPNEVKQHKYTRNFSFNRECSKFKKTSYKKNFQIRLTQLYQKNKRDGKRSRG